jgi:hypothetical protein
MCGSSCGDKRTRLARRGWKLNEGPSALQDFVFRLVCEEQATQSCQLLGELVDVGSLLVLGVATEGQLHDLVLSEDKPGHQRYINAYTLSHSREFGCANVSRR